MVSDKFKEVLDGLKKDLKRYETKDSGFDNKLNELKSNMNKLESMGIPEFKKEDDSFMTKAKEKDQSVTKKAETEKLMGKPDTAEFKEKPEVDKKPSESETVKDKTKAKDSEGEKPTAGCRSTYNKEAKSGLKESETKEEKKPTAEPKETKKDEKSESNKEELGPQKSAQEENQLETSISKLKETIPPVFKSVDEKMDRLQDSILHLDEAIKNLISIIDNATKELAEDPDKELGAKMDKIIEQNDKILSKLDDKPKKDLLKEELCGSPFLPKANLPPEMEPVKYHSAPKPPEDDTIPKLKPRKGKYNV